MGKYLITIITVCLFTLSLIGQDRITLSLNTGVGYDFQTRSNNYNRTGPLYIESPTKFSILHIEKPYQVSMSSTYKINDNLRLVLCVGQSSRALRYWSLDDTIAAYSYLNDKIDLTVKSYFIEPGISFKSNLPSNLNWFWEQSVGIGLGKRSPRATLTKDHSQAELIYLQRQEYAALVQVEMGTPTISLVTKIGLEYLLYDKISLTFGLKYINEIRNGDGINIWAYDLDGDRKTGAYTPYDLEFKTIMSEIGIRYQL